MKKIVCLALMLVMMLCAVGAMAWSVTGSPENIENDYANNVLTFKAPGTYIIKDWNATGRIVLNGAGKYNLTLEDVNLTAAEPTSIEGSPYVIGYIVDDGGSIDLTLNLHNTTLKAEAEDDNTYMIWTESVAPEGGKGGTVNLTINAVNSTVSGGAYGVYANSRASDNQRPGSAVTVAINGTESTFSGKAIGVLAGSDDLGTSVALDGNDLSVSCEDEGVYAVAARQVYVGSKENSKVDLFVNDTLLDAFIDKTEIDAEVLMDAKKMLLKKNAGNAEEYSPDAKVDDLSVFAANDLPQTGDSSSLALWLCLLAMAGAGMTAMRKREA